MTKRKGARSIQAIPPDILAQLQAGSLETANLMEWLAIDPKQLLQQLLTKEDRLLYYAPVIDRLDALVKQTVNTKNEAIGQALFGLAKAANDLDWLSGLAKHPSDVVRCWAAYSTASDTALDISLLLKAIRPFAADAHFGVREIAWLAVRRRIAADLAASLTILSQWALSEDENIRRFASEATRPRGVWCLHLEELKADPAKGLSILEPLAADPSLYVQKSVGNWLNDAAKTQPDFVRAVCNHWLATYPTKATAFIAKKALRSLSD